MLSQVAGRAGRKATRGKVLIQTYQPHHPIIQQVLEGDYERMLAQQLNERKDFYYPPYNRLIRVTVIESDIEKVKKASQWIANVLLQAQTGQILGPVFPNDGSRTRAKQIINKTLDRFDSVAMFRSCRVNLDVDPY